jgi:hypothetical protein
MRVLSSEHFSCTESSSELVTIPTRDLSNFVISATPGGGAPALS